MVKLFKANKGSKGLAKKKESGSHPRSLLQISGRRLKIVVMKYLNALRSLYEFFQTERSYLH